MFIKDVCKKFLQPMQFIKSSHDFSDYVLKSICFQFFKALLK